MMVCEKGNLEMTEAVLAQKGVDLLLTDNRNLNAAFYAIENRNKLNGYSILKLLLTREPSLVLCPSIRYLTGQGIRIY